MGVAMPSFLADRFPRLCPRLWLELDIIPVVLPEEKKFNDLYTLPDTSHGWNSRNLDEQSESMGRKCIRFARRIIPLLDKLSRLTLAGHLVQIIRP